jgi:hypothetical protein
MYLHETTVVTTVYTVVLPLASATYLGQWCISGDVDEFGSMVERLSGKVEETLREIFNAI